MRRAGAIADGHITDADDLDHIRQAVTLMDEGARTAGRDPVRLRLALMQNAFVVERGDGWPIVRDGALHQNGAYEAWAAGHDTPSHDSLEPFVEDEAETARTTLAGTPEEVLLALRPSSTSSAIATWRSLCVFTIRAWSSSLPRAR